MATISSGFSRFGSVVTGIVIMIFCAFVIVVWGHGISSALKVVLITGDLVCAVWIGTMKSPLLSNVLFFLLLVTALVGTIAVAADGAQRQADIKAGIATPVK